MIALKLDVDPTNARRSMLFVRLHHLPDVAAPDNFAVDLNGSDTLEFSSIGLDGVTRSGYWRQFHEREEPPHVINCYVSCEFVYGPGVRLAAGRLLTPLR